MQNWYFLWPAPSTLMTFNCKSFFIRSIIYSILFIIFGCSFIPKRECDYVNCLTILDKIESKSDLKVFLEEKNRHSPDIRMALAFDYNLKKLVRRYGDFYVNLFRHNQEIARYAKQNADEVLAVISNDTDFMAFEGNAKIGQFRKFLF